MNTMTTMTLDDLKNLPPLTDAEKATIKNARATPTDDCPAMTKEELKEFRPWYAKTKKPVTINLDTGAIAYFKELAEETGMRDKVLYSSFNHYSMMHIKEIDPSIPCGLLYDAMLYEPWKYASALKADAIHPHFSELQIAGEVEAAHALGLMVNVWTVNAAEDVLMSLKAGADIIISNYPDRALKVRSEFLSAR